MAKPDPNDPDNKSWGGNKDEGQCPSCGGSGVKTADGKKIDCPACSGSGKK